MGDENTLLDPPSARQLLRRAAFGAHPEMVQDILDSGLSRGQAVDEMLAFQKGRKPGGRYIEKVHDKWLKFMIKTKYPLQEKLVLFWHDHFATSNQKVVNPKTMAQQNRLLRLMCKGSMADLVKAMNKDAAMIEWLDTVRNRKQVPNENYARELMELFTLGVLDFAGNPNYLQTDIVQIARAFTGWRYEYNSGESYLDSNGPNDPGPHDYMIHFQSRGPKRIFKSTGPGGFSDPNGQPFAPGNPNQGLETLETALAEIDLVTDILFQHKDSEGKKTIARRTARRLFEYFAHPLSDPISVADKALVDALITTSGFDTNWNIGGLVRAILTHDEFYATGKPSVSWPADYIVSTFRLLGMKPKHTQYGDQVAGGSFQFVRTQMDNMGQLLLEPPSVFGWDWETAWISSSSLLARYNFARDMVSSRGGGSSSFRPDRLMDLSLTTADDIVDAVLNVLGVSDQYSATEKQVFHDYLLAGEDPNDPPNPYSEPLNLFDYDYRNTKLHGLFALVLQSAGYQTH